MPTTPQQQHAWRAAQQQRQQGGRYPDVFGGPGRYPDVRPDPDAGWGSAGSSNWERGGHRETTALLFVGLMDVSHGLVCTAGRRRVSGLVLLLRALRRSMGLIAANGLLGLTNCVLLGLLSTSVLPLLGLATVLYTTTASAPSPRPCSRLCPCVFAWSDG